MSNAFSPEKSELAALLQGDPNPIHYRINHVGVQIAPGLEMLARGLQATGWKPGHIITIEFKDVLKLPSNAAIQTTPDGFEVRDDKISYATAAISKRYVWRGFEAVDAWDYELMENTPQQRVPFDKVNGISRAQVRGLYSNDDGMTDAIAAMGIAANAFARSISAHADWMPELYFPPIRQDGQLGVLEQKIEVEMGARTNLGEKFMVFVERPYVDPENQKRGMVLSADVPGLYVLRMYLVQLPMK